jgi:transcriptional regulator with XRE-family HTH domain
VPKRLSQSGAYDAPGPDLDVTELGRLVRQKRTDEHLSVRQAADTARVSFSTLSRVEAGAQPDLSTFMSLCGWLGVEPSRFFAPIARRSLTPLDEAIEHLITDPALSSEAAERIASVVRDLYLALAHQSPPESPPPMALHLRAASVMRPGVPERLASLLTDMRERLEQSSSP